MSDRAVAAVVVVVVVESGPRREAKAMAGSLTEVVGFEVVVAGSGRARAMATATATAAFTSAVVAVRLGRTKVEVAAAGPPVTRLEPTGPLVAVAGLESRKPSW